MPAPAARRRIGWIIHRQAMLYAQEYGWDVSYEGLVAQILGGFVERFDPECENAWVAESAGAIVGSVFVVRESAAIARLRLLYVEPAPAAAESAGISSILASPSRARRAIAHFAYGPMTFSCPPAASIRPPAFIW